MPTHPLTIVCLTCVLAGCSPQPAPSAGSNSVDGATFSSSIQPGLYRTTVTFLEFGVPGAGSDNLNMAPETSENCVTSSDISQFVGDSQVSFNPGETCTQNRMSSDRGRIEIEETCAREAGVSTLRISGTYTNNHIDMEIASTGETPDGRMTQRMRMVSDRVGECPAVESAP